MRKSKERDNAKKLVLDFHNNSVVPAETMKVYLSDLREAEIGTVFYCGYEVEVIFKSPEKVCLFHRNSEGEPEGLQWCNLT